MRRHRLAAPIQSAPRTIAVIGPGADDARCLFGCYSFPNHVLPHYPDVALGVEAPTVLEGIRREFPESDVRYVQGCEIIGGEREQIAAAVAAAKEAELAVLVVGDRSGMFGRGTSGEGCDVATLELPGAQEELATAVLAAANASVLLVVSGRPYSISRHAKSADASVQAFFPGQEGAAAKRDPAGPSAHQFHAWTWRPVSDARSASTSMPT